jgi:hypothetical protein
VAGTCEYGNEPSGYVKIREISLERLVSFSRRTVLNGVSFFIYIYVCMFCMLLFNCVNYISLLLCLVNPVAQSV